MTKRLDALKVALNNEMKEHEFYLTNAKRTKNAVGKAMFEQIAKEELEHHDRLMQLHENWVKEKKWPDTVPLKVKETTVKNVLREATKKAPKEDKGDADDLKALQVAIEFEGKGAENYARLRDQVSDSREKAFFNLLADIEHEHYVSLKDTEQYMIDPAAWYREKGKGGLDGA